MKNVFLIPVFLLLSVALFSFKTMEQSPVIKVTVTGETTTTFDMFRNNETVKGLKTPYEIRKGKKRVFEGS